MVNSSNRHRAGIAVRYRGSDPVNRRFKEALFVSIVGLSILALSACGLLGLQQEVVPAALCIEVTDPVFRRITEVTDTFQISASGNFHPGTTLIRGLPVNVPPDTSFQLELTLPIKDPSKIETAGAVGSIVMNKQISIAGAPLPQKVVLEDGKASGRIDLIRLLGVYISTHCKITQCQLPAAVKCKSCSTRSRSVTPT